jgi:hypothetical protein
MRITKVLETNIDITDPVNVYSSPDTRVLEILANKFNGKCYKACYIEKVNKIIKRGSCRINKYGAPNIGTVSVAFEVSGIIYAPGEIINGCTFINRDANGIITLRKNNITIMTEDATNKYESLNSRQLVSIRVGIARYRVNGEGININGVILSFPTKTDAYKIAGGLNSEDITFLKEAIEEHNNELGQLKNKIKGNEDVYTFFSGLLSPFKKQTSMGKHNMTLDGLIKSGAKDLFVGIDPQVGIGEPHLFVGADPDEKYHNIVSNVDKRIAMVEVISALTNNIRTIREYLEIYNTKESIGGHKNIWRIYDKQKI